MLRAKSSVFSRIGILISENPKFSKTSRAIFSINCHPSISLGRMSLNPRMALITRDYPPGDGCTIAEPINTFPLNLWDQGPKVKPEAEIFSKIDKNS